MGDRKDVFPQEVAALRQAIFDNHFQPIPLATTEINVRNSGKRPIDAGWPDLEGVPETSLAALNTGIRLEGLLMADVDVDDREAAAVLVGIVKSVLGETIRRDYGGPRTALLYRVAENTNDFQPITTAYGKIELRSGRGLQCAAFGVHWSGGSLAWPDGGPDRVRREDLPEVSQEAIDRLRATISKSRFHGADASAATKPNGPTKLDLDLRNNTVIGSDADAALETLPNNYDRAAWIKIGASACAAGASFEAFNRWSARHETYNPQDTATAWESFAKFETIGSGTLYREVFERIPGWQKPSERGPIPNGAAFSDGLDGAPLPADEPLPLYPDPGAPTPYPVEALGFLREPVEAIVESIGADPGLAAQSVLMAAALATMGLADVMLPIGQRSPLALYLVTIARSGERKSAADRLASLGITDRAADLHHEYMLAAGFTRAARRAYEAEARMIERDKTLTYEERKAKLAALDEPRPLRRPAFTSSDLTVEGLLKNWQELPPVHAFQTPEGGLFVSGAAMNDELRMRSVSALSAQWSGEGVEKLRAGDGIISARGKRLTMHVMIQPTFAPDLLGDERVRSQGFLSRLLTSWPPSRIGFRDNLPPTPAAQAKINTLRVRISGLLSRTLPDELDPRPVPIEGEAAAEWLAYSREIERVQQPGARYADLTDCASKSAEMAARIAGVLTIIEDPDAASIPAGRLQDGIALARWYLEEALRLARGRLLDPKLADAAVLLEWLHEHPQHRTLRSVMRYGPGRMRIKSVLDPLLAILATHGWIDLPRKGPIGVRAGQPQEPQS